MNLNQTDKAVKDFLYHQKNFPKPSNQFFKGRRNFGFLPQKPQNREFAAIYGKFRGTCERTGRLSNKSINSSNQPEFKGLAATLRGAARPCGRDKSGELERKARFFAKQKMCTLVLGTPRIVNRYYREA
jgi:hypothetical protein